MLVDGDGYHVVFQCSSLLKAVLTCLLFATIYVGSLYVWRTKLPRDDPSTIKRRSLSACLVSVLAPFVVMTQAHHTETTKGHPLWHYLGVKQSGLLAALFLPVLLTMILFSGPLYMMILGDIRRRFPVLLMPRKWWLNSHCVATSVRNYVVGPITEEIVFRACMLPLLVPCMGNLNAVFICPLFFGVAHVHHVIESLKLGFKKPCAIWLGAVFQFFYTTVFGALSAFIFLRTGHLIACILTHMFCNFMGFPAFEEITGHSMTQRVVICAMFVLGLVLFIVLLQPLTSPELYLNTVYQWS